jgi:L-asparaginase II
MLGACVERGWPLESYRERDHPLQAEVLSAVLMATERDDVRIGVDGCGVPVHGFPLSSMATIYARLARPERLGRFESPARRAVGAMRAEPYMVAGRDRVDTAVMEACDQVVVKAGAEGMICAALVDRGLGVALKVRDGASRAVGPALIKLLAALDVLDGSALARLEAFARPPVLGGGEQVGELVAEFEVSRP